jgi:hypothetical protein
VDAQVERAFLLRGPFSALRTDAAIAHDAKGRSLEFDPMARSFYGYGLVQRRSSINASAAIAVE